jgi:SAM-dependent methyltransferase
VHASDDDVAPIFERSARRLGDVPNVDVWEQLGASDPLWANLAEPNKSGGRWDPDDFLRAGQIQIDDCLGRLRTLERMDQRDSALDFGCGAGRLTQGLATYFAHVTGVDISSSMIDAARRLNRRGAQCTFQQVSGSDLRRFENRQFDLVFSSLVLIHLPPRTSIELLREFLRVTREGGFVVFDCMGPPRRPLYRKIPFLDWMFNRSATGPRVYSGVYWLRRKIRGLPVGGWGMHWLTPEEIAAEVASGGAKIVLTEDLPTDGLLMSLRYYVKLPGGRPP